MGEENFITMLARQIKESTVRVSKNGTVVEMFSAPIPESIQAGINANLGNRAKPIVPDDKVIAGGE